MQFQVPQFIEVEDKIFGPLTFKQFVYIAGGAGVAYIIWRSLPSYLAFPLVIAFGGLGVALAFFQYNGQPFILALEHGFFYLVHSKLYLWNNEQATQRKKKQQVPVPASIANQNNPYVPRLSESKLHDLSWSLDINERISMGTGNAADRDRAATQHRSIVAPVRTARDAIPQ